MNRRNIVLLLFLAMLSSCKQQQYSDNGENIANNNTNAEAATPAGRKKNILFFGNSLTAAYGLNPSDGFVSLLQLRLDSLGLPYQTINAGLSGETTAAGRERVDWVLRQPVDIFVLELGGNDALRGVLPNTSFENLDAIIQKVKGKYPQARIILAGMEAPPNLGQRYTSQFRQMYPKLAEKHGTALIPFFLENVGGILELNQGDRIHPNEEGQKILVENVWRVLKGLL